MEEDSRSSRRREEEEVSEEVEEIDPDHVPALDPGQGPAPEDEDLGLDRIQEVVLNPGRTQKIVLNHAPRKIQEETDLDPGLDPRITTETRMETGHLLRIRMDPGLDLALPLVHDPDPEASKSCVHSS